MKVGFIGNYQNGYVGEISDESHLARGIEELGHEIYRIPRDEWREYVIEGFPVGKYPNIPENITFDIVIICKWHHFYDGSFIIKAREKYKCPVFLWVWDYMWDEGFPEWHILMAKCSDLYLTNEYGIKYKYKQHGVNNLYYFPFDVCDFDIPSSNQEKKYDVVFTGSCIGQGHRMEWLTKINEMFPITVFAWNWEEWKKRGFRAYPAVYGAEYNTVIAQSKIILGFSVNPSCWGYWSNRVGKVLRNGGCLLYEYAPGMELLLGDAVAYFSSPDEAIEKIAYLMSHDEERERLEQRASEKRYDFSSKYRVKQLMILAERYIKTHGTNWDY